jgi:RimJ/RimL family protein N-acetyltransferase
VRTDATGNGIATTAARLAARFGFEVLGLQRIEITVPIGHRASARVAEKLGARREGVLRHRLRLHGTPAGAVLFGLLPSDL